MALRSCLAALVVVLAPALAPAAQTTPFPYSDSAEDTTAALARWTSSTTGARFFTSTEGARAHTGTRAWRLQPGGTLTLSRPVSLAGRTNPHLRLWARSTYVGTDPNDRACRDSFDGGYGEAGGRCGAVTLEVSTDGGSVWETIWSTSPLGEANSQDLTHYATGGRTPTPMVRSGMWQFVHWPLDAYAGSSVLLRLTVHLDHPYLEAALDDLVLDEAPRPLDPVVTAATNRGFTVSWPASTAPDFRRYRLVVSTEEEGCSLLFTARQIRGGAGQVFENDVKCVGGATNPYSLPLRLWRSERQVVEIADRNRTSVVLDTLAFSGRRYFVRLYEQDTQGFTNQGGAVEPATTALDYRGAVTAPFVERFDAGSVPAGWLLEPTWGLSNEASAEPGHSAPGVLTDSPGTNYRPYTYQHARVKVDLSAVTRPLLRFRHRYSTYPNTTNGGVGNTDEDDIAFVQVSRDGMWWVPLGSNNGSADWTEQAFDLSEYGGLDVVYLRFGFHDDHSVRLFEPSGSFEMISRTRQGWLIDDVEIADNVAVATLPFEDDAEADGQWISPFFRRATVGDAHSGTTVWRARGSAYHNNPYYTNGSYSPGFDGGVEATSWFTLATALDLRGVENPTLSFWARTRGARPAAQHEYMIQASVDGGQTWGAVPIPSSYVGGPDWQRYSFSLDGIQASRALVRIGLSAPNIYDFWQEFDDFAITGTPAAGLVSGTVEFRLRSIHEGTRLTVPPGTVVGVRGVDAPLSTTETFPLSDADGDGVWTGRVPLTAPLGSRVRYLFVQLADGNETTYTDCNQYGPTSPHNYLSFTYTGSATVLHTWPCWGGHVEATPGEGVSFFTVTGGGAPDHPVLSTGFHPQATNGLDEPYGEVEMPPVPPPGTFTARWVSGDGVDLGQGSLVDLRAGGGPASGRVAHHLLLQRATGGGPFVLHYDLPDLVWAQLADAATGALYNQTFWGRGQLHIPADGDIGAVERFTLTLTYGQTCAAAPLAPGWNLVSAPLRAASMAPADLFPGVSNPYGFDGRYVSVGAFVPGAGYWVKADDGGVPALCGALVVPAEIPVRAGWNLIGGFQAETAVEALATSTPGLVTSSVFGYAGGYAEANALVPARGYWVRASSAGTLRVGEGGPAGRRSPELAAGRAAETGEAEGALVLIVEDAAGHRAALRLLDAATAEADAVLPPVPPSDLFDARLLADGEGRRAVPAAAADLVLQGVTFPVALRVEGLVDGSTLAVSDALGRPLGVVGAGGSLALASGARFRLALSGEAAESLPLALALGPVAPNPTRGSATLAFSLPEAGPVRLAVYDVLGREVVRLADGEVPAGEHRASLPEGALAPGVYVVRLEAGGEVLARAFTVAR